METNYLTKNYHSISVAKATHLYWLGRYAERIYMSLHQVRKYYDLMIDQDHEAYVTFCHHMGIENQYLSAEDFMQKYLFDASNPDSVINMLELANNNAILLREEIKSETLSYLQLCRTHIKELRYQNINELQMITDSMLAFWGSVDQRIFSSPIRHTIKLGKYIESLDLHLRFNYPFRKIEPIYHRLLEVMEEDPFLYDEMIALHLKSKFTFDDYKDHQLLAILNRLFSPKD